MVQKNIKFHKSPNIALELLEHFEYGFQKVGHTITSSKHGAMHRRKKRLEAVLESEYKNKTSRLSTLPIEVMKIIKWILIGGYCGGSMACHYGEFFFS